MGIEVRCPTIDEAAELAEVIADYVREHYPRHRIMDRDEVAGALFGPERMQRPLVALEGGRIVGFACWRRHYLLHWGKRGGGVDDLYVAPSARGRGIAAMLIAAASAAIRDDGGSYIQTGSYDRAAATGALYERVGVGHDSAECYVSGRAFRAIADLAGATAREIVERLPPKEWNFEP